MKKNNKKVDIIKKAREFARQAHDGQMRKSGEPFFIHPELVAELLESLGMDEETIAAGYLHDVLEDTEVTFDQLKEEFGEEIAMLVNGVTKLGHVEFSSKEEQQAENLRRMLLAMADDIRVIIIKLADRLHNMRTLKYRSKEHQKTVSQETLDIYAPLANRLGIFKIKWELEDLAFMFLMPNEYSELAKLVALRRQEREDIIEDKIKTIQKELTEHGIKADIEGRPKHFYSIYQKMTNQHKAFDQIYDLTAIRIIVDDLADCYGALGIVHTIWTPIPGRFKDYIAMPKPNLYQSLHTTLMGEHGIPFEVQIRTREMHATAEYGIAAHWRYKEGTDVEKSYESKLSWLRQILEWQSDATDAREFMDTIKMDLFSDEVFVFTPKADVINLPTGSTPIDFAYKVHSAVGNSCIGAKVNSKMVPLDTELKTGDIVEIVTSKSSSGPSRDWLKIAISQQAKSKIRAYFKKERRDENIDKGRAMLEEAAKRYNFPLNEALKNSEWMEKLYAKFTLKSVSDIYAAIGYGGISTGQIISRLQAEYEKENKEVQPPRQTAEKPKTKTKPSSTGGVVVKGEKNMLVRFAKCCNPIPGDSIIGYITRGRGVSVHRTDCFNMKNLPPEDQRVIEVSWEGETVEKYSAVIKAVFLDEQGLLVRISNIMQSIGTTLLKLNAEVNPQSNATMELSVEVSKAEQLENLIKQIKKMPECVEVYRKIG